MAAAGIQSMVETLPVEPTIQIKLQMPHPPKGVPGAGGPSKMRNRLRLDPSRALEPARKKIATIEAQRVMSVFEDTIRRIEMVSILPYLLINIDRFRISLGSELAGHLENHQVIQESYQEIKQQLDIQIRRNRKQRQKAISRPSTGGSFASEGRAESQYSGGDDTTAPTMPTEESEMQGDKGMDVFDEDDAQSDRQSISRQSDVSNISAASFNSTIDRTMRNLNLVAQQLSTSCKNIIRCFQLNTAAMKTIMNQAHSQIPTSNQMLIQYLNELREILLNKLLTTPEEESERMDYIQEISLRERNNAAIIEKLEEELRAAMADKDEEIKKKNDVIRRIQADLRQIEKFSEENMKRVQTEAEKQEAADIKTSDGKKQRLLQELQQLKTQNQNLITEHRESEQDLRRKKFRVESQVENLIQKFDADMTERQDEYEEIDAEYTKEKKQLHELEERFKTLEDEYQQIMEERRVAREKREAAERDMANMVKSATTIQAFWRSFKVRKALKGRKKKGGGGKKKK
ncbi:IQ domain-containing protein D-like [Mizuhopecten yessoensis]|uniref:Dynein regulatory complex protein 10 n=1 Tax=Mizuhopecten yessoensis TaxID=6573 RepID=A0A210Q0K3_MIZYE|nr:IQ domain-containing protein D-like [Mizuhopecten yessoensis]OWF42252.1 IQ domain-containing protein D [Mizuhopecten yessoensis]